MTRSKQRQYRLKHGIVDIRQWCPRCNHFNVVRLNHKYGGKPNKRCYTAQCPGPDKGEACSPPNEVIEKHIEYLRPFGRGLSCYNEANIEYWESILRKRRGEKLPAGQCVKCKQNRPLKKLVFDGKAGGLRCLDGRDNYWRCE